MHPTEIRHPRRRDEVADVEDAWRCLVGDAPGGSFFSTPDWCLAWWEAAGHPPLSLALWHGDDGRIDAVAALVEVREPFHRRLPGGLPALANLGTGPGAADHAGWPVVPARRDDVREWVAQQARSTSIVLRNLDPEGATAIVPARARLLSRTECPRLEIPADPEAIGSGRKFRAKLRQYARRLDREGVSFRWVGPGEVDESVLDALVGLHHRRMELKGATSAFSTAGRETLRRLVARPEPGVGPAAVIAERDAEPVGVLWGFWWDGVFSYYQTGWDPELASLSLGTALVAAAIRLAGEHGADVFDFLRGAEDYKYRFGAADRVDETWLVPTGVAGRALWWRHRAAVTMRARRGRVTP